MNNIQQTVKTFLEKFSIDNSEKTYLVAFSGGYDSMCLLHALKKVSKNKIVAIHLNHNWRGEESLQEANNCREFCNSIGVEFYCESLSKDLPHTETVAREARYNFFEKCAKKFNSQTVFTAHNKNDNAETLLYRISMGTGITGLQGICAQRDIFYRPLLTIKRDNIEKYCQNFKLNPNLDSSNLDTKYKRNFIRANILPELEKINPDIIDKLNSLSEIAQDETEILNEYIKNITEKISEDKKLKTSKFVNLSKSIQNKIIYNIFLTHNLDYDRKKILTIQNFIEESKNSKSGKTCALTDNLWLFVSNKFIEIFSENQTFKPYFQITKEGIYKSNGYVFELEKFNKAIKKFPLDSENIAYVNLNKTPINFEIRTRQDGDFIYPLGLKGSQKLKKYLNEKKIPNHEKDNLLFLAQGNEIFWAIGLGISDKIKITTAPTHRMKLYKEEK
jgi:tRNA(Ile)-lysidine synthase